MKPYVKRWWLHRKRVSKRRWKARCREHRDIPATAILEHRLDKWFDFIWNPATDTGKALEK